MIAAQRGRMFVDMGEMTPAQVQEQLGLWAAWLRAAMPAGEYAGFLVEHGRQVEHGTQVVAGVGVVFHPRVPTLSDPATRRAHILHMSVDPERRRRGLAEALMHAALAHARACGLRNVTLNAAPMGKRLYERPGFTQARSPEMRLTLGDA